MEGVFIVYLAKIWVGKGAFLRTNVGHDYSERKKQNEQGN